jgi:hypothetical protein
MKDGQESFYVAYRGAVADPGSKYMVSLATSVQNAIIPFRKERRVPI